MKRVWIMRWCCGLALGAMSIQGAQSEERRLGPALRPQAESSVIPQFGDRDFERTSLRQYLSESRRGDELMVRDELARLEFHREMERGERGRWWQRFAENRREREINRYWEAYYSGRQYGESLIERSSGAADQCRILRSEALSSGPTGIAEPWLQAILRDAFRRGMVSAAPECLMEDSPTRLRVVRSMDEELSALQGTLRTIQRDLVRSRPDERRLHELADEWARRATAMAEKLVAEALPVLGTITGLNEADRQILERRAASLAQAIDCANLEDSSGRKANCAILFAPPLQPLDRSAGFRVLFGKEPLGAFQPRVILKPLLDAVSEYLLRVPGDELVRLQKHELRTWLENLDHNRETRLSGLHKDFHEQLVRAQRELAWAGDDLWKRHFSRASRDALIDRFVALRSKIRAYARWETGAPDEVRALEKVRSQYERSLAEALETRLDLQLPSREVVVRLDDAAGTRITLPVQAAYAPAGLLMGETPEEVEFWRSSLQLDLE